MAGSGSNFSRIALDLSRFWDEALNPPSHAIKAGKAVIHDISQLSTQYSVAIFARKNPVADFADTPRLFRLTFVASYASVTHLVAVV